MVQLDLNLGYFGPAVLGQPGMIESVEDLGYRTAWVAEAYGSDAVTVASWIGARTKGLGVGTAILQIHARTPAMTAMTAATLDDLTGGRFRLGLGVSGPQVVEGWHGVPFGKPLGRTREYVAIVRAILERQAPVSYDGDYYQIPYGGDDAVGVGKALKLIGGSHPDVDIYLAAIGPKNVALAAEIADGWLPVLYSPERSSEVFDEPLAMGLAASGEKGKADRFEVVPTVSAYIHDDLETAREAVRPHIALYVGGMGAKGRNFYNDLCVRYGFAEAAAEIQSLYLGGDKRAAIEAVPDALVDEVSLVGPAGRVADRLDAWRESGVSAIAISSMDPETIRLVPTL